MLSGAAPRSARLGDAELSPVGILLQVNTYIEDRIAQKEKLTKILRLMCMQSVCNNGLKQKVLDYYKREIFQVSAEPLWALEDGPGQLWTKDEAGE